MENKLVKLSLAATLGLAMVTMSALAVENETVELDTLILYSQGSVDKYGGDAETRINHLISTSNQIYTDSGLNVKLNAVKIQQYEMDDAATSGTILSAIRKDTAVHEIRNAVGADQVIMYRPYANDGACGIAYQNNYLNNPSATWVEKYMYSHVSIDCGGYVTAHEVGHNTGLGHSEAQGSTGAYEYARGHGVQDNFTTVMAYSGVYNGSKIYKYSSPSLDCNGLPCGIEEGEDKAADAVKALIQTVPLVANFRAHIDLPDNNDTDDNNTDDGDDGDDNTDDGADKLAAALKAYTDQKEKVAEDKEELNRLKSVLNEKKEAYIVLRTEKKVKKIALKKAISGLKKAFRVVWEKRKARSITRAEFRAAKTAYRNARRTLYTEYREYIASVVKPAYYDYKEARTAYRTFYKDTYRVDKKKLRELRKAYYELKKVYG